MRQNKQPFNEKGQEHGCWETYNDDGTVWYKCNYINGLWHGYFEYSIFGKIIKEYAAR
jgi:antitoxin component YwqK of YwqJK toxin-antitoxin module